MRTFRSNKGKLIVALAGGVLFLFFFKLYLFITDRNQFEDSNALVSVLFVGAVTVIIYVILRLISVGKPSSK